jgi:hypothetical protein
MEASWAEAFDYSGKRKDDGCIALRVSDEVPSLGKTQAAVAHGIHHAMNRSGKRRKSQAGVANDRRKKIKIDNFLVNLLDPPTSLGGVSKFRNCFG